MSTQFSFHIYSVSPFQAIVSKSEHGKCVQLSSTKKEHKDNHGPIQSLYWCYVSNFILLFKDFLGSETYVKNWFKGEERKYT